MFDLDRLTRLRIIDRTMSIVKYNQLCDLGVRCQKLEKIKYRLHDIMRFQQTLSCSPFLIFFSLYISGFFLRMGLCSLRVSRITQ